NENRSSRLRRARSWAEMNMSCAVNATLTTASAATIVTRNTSRPRMLRRAFKGAATTASQPTKSVTPPDRTRNKPSDANSAGDGSSSQELTARTSAVSPRSTATEASTRRGLSSAMLGLELVANAPDRFKKQWALWVGLDLFAQPANVDGDGAR